MAETRPFVICDADELTALQVLPFHTAMRSASGRPPALVTSPPTYSAPGVTVSAEATRSSESLPALPTPRWSQPPGPAADADATSAAMTTARHVSTRRRSRLRAGPTLPITMAPSIWDAGGVCGRPRVQPAHPTLRLAGV